MATAASGCRVNRVPLGGDKTLKFGGLTTQVYDQPPLKRSSSFQFLPPDMSELRVVLLGSSWSERRSVGNLILGETEFNTEEPDCCLTGRGRLKEKDIVVINTPDLLPPNISQHKLTEFIKDCVRVSDPGPHVFLLVLQPEDFTEEHKLKLCRVLEKFTDRSFDHSLVLISTPREESSAVMEKYMEQPPLKDMIRKCRYRYLKLKNLERSELLTRLGQTAKENNGEHVSCEAFKGTTSDLPGLLKKLQEELEQEREKYEKKRKEEEEERKHMEENYKKKIENLKKTHEEEARKQAEEFNEFREKYKKETAALKEEMKDKDKQYDILKALSAHKEEEMKKKHQDEICALVKCVIRKRGNMKKISELLEKQNKEMQNEKNEEEKKNLQQKHEKEISDLIQELSKGADSECCIS